MTKQTNLAVNGVEQQRNTRRNSPKEGISQSNRKDYKLAEKR